MTTSTSVLLRHRLLSAAAVTALLMSAPHTSLAQNAAPTTQSEALAQIQQMQRQMELLQKQIQQLPPGQRLPAPVAQAPVAQAPIRLTQPQQPMMAQPKKVSAKGKNKSVQHRPKAATALNKKQLQQRNITRPLALASSVPSMNSNHVRGLGASNATYIRGIGNSDSMAGYDPAVGTTVDGIFIARQNFNDFSFFDVDRVEVLRGSQGTAGGRNIAGGSVDVYFQKPQGTLSGNTEIGYGKNSTKFVRGTINAPISDMLLSQVSLYYNDDNGYVKNTTTADKLNDMRNYGVRIATQFRASDALTWDLGINHFYSDEQNALNFTCKMFGTTFASPGAPTPKCKGRFARTGLRGDIATPLASLTVPTVLGATPTTLGNTQQERPIGAPSRMTLVSSDIGYDINQTTKLSFITGFVNLSQASLFDAQDGRQGRSLSVPNPVPVITPGATNGYYAMSNKTGASQWSQEIKAAGDVLNGAIEYVGGIYFFKESNHTDAADIVLSSVIADRNIKTTSRSVAGYLQTDLHVTQNFMTTVGVRYTHEKKKLALADNRNAGAPISAGVPRPDLRFTTSNLIAAGLPDRVKTKSLTPHVALSYTVDDDALVYISATRGFRAPGWNMRGQLVTDFTTYLPEKIWTYEAGAKAEWLDSRIRTNLALFNIEAKNFQVLSDTTGINGIPAFQSTTPAAFRNRGVETEVLAMPFDGMTFFANMAYQKAAYRAVNAAVKVQAAACKGLIAAAQSGQDVCGVGIVTSKGLIAAPERTPKFTGATGLALDMPTGVGFTFSPAANISYQGKWENSASNVSFFASADPGVNPLAVTTTPNASGGSGFISGSRSGGFFLFNASMAVSTDDSMWRASVECENCLNKAYPTSSFAGFSYLNEPVRWTFKLKYGF